MPQNYIGELAALATAIFWMITALAFESAGKKVGSLSVNIIRLSLAFIYLGIFSFFTRGVFLPEGANAHNWIWLSVSGLVGFVLGDLFLFQAYVVIGARISMLIMSLAPPIAAISGWLLMGETMNKQGLFGMALTFIGISIAILARKKNDDPNTLLRQSIHFKYPLKGILLAFGGAAGQGIGLVLSRYGIQELNPFAATQIRVITGLVGFIIVISYVGFWPRVLSAVTNYAAMKRMGVGAFFGPFLGVSFSLLAVQHTTSGVASTIMSIVPVLIIAPSVIFMKEKITWIEVIGAVIAVAGVSLFFI
ncbi:MAG TPA: DMT family transporter [Lentimicrobium sp.]|nr:DMT family transporter [Lentimicrobium sp.]